MAHLHALLDPAERSRADRYRLADDRRRSVAAWGGLRLLAAAALRLAPQALAFALGPAGKPVLRDDPLQFNLSHSGGVVLIALSSHHPVGVDVEQLRPLPDHRDIARHHFHPAEVADLAALAEPEATRAFFRCWTRKEAVSKALGLGLGLPLDSFRVACHPRRRPRLLSMAGMGHPPPWTLADLPPMAGHVAAVALPSPGISLRCRSLAIPLG